MWRLSFFIGQNSWLIYLCSREHFFTSSPSCDGFLSFRLYHDKSTCAPGSIFISSPSCDGIHMTPTDFDGPMRRSVSVRARSTALTPFGLTARFCRSSMYAWLDGGRRRRNDVWLSWVVTSKTDCVDHDLRKNTESRKIIARRCSSESKWPQSNRKLQLNIVPGSYAGKQHSTASPWLSVCEESQLLKVSGVSKCLLYRRWAGPGSLGHLT